MIRAKPGRCVGGGLRLGFEFVRVFGCFGFVGRWAGWLGGQEPDGQDGACRGDAAGDEDGDGQAAQERVGGGVLQRQAQGRVAEGAPETETQAHPAAPGRQPAAATEGSLWA